MCDQEVESCGCVDEECIGARIQEGGADTAGVWTVAGNSSEQFVVTNGGGVVLNILIVVVQCHEILILKDLSHT